LLLRLIDYSGNARYNQSRKEVRILMNYELLGLIAVYLLNTFILVGILYAQNAKYDAKFDAQSARTDAVNLRIDKCIEDNKNLHKEIMELIKKIRKIRR
jgi:hypothetical protein